MRVTEIFRSLQGEGRDQGLITTFIRLTGCNLDCRWCDTRYARSGGEDRTRDEVLAEVHALGCRRICITGGEPLLQARELLPLLSALHHAGYVIGIETNGTLDFRPFQPFASICMDVKCPSSGEESDLSLLAHLTGEDSVKFVVAGEEDCEYARRIIGEHPIRAEILFSPVFGTDCRAIADYVLTQDLPARFQLQLHRILGVR
ncbi:MAG: radical SAM protein [Methanomicrobiales archaeon]|nr:Radical domain protein [Methanomicrobia archaeon]MDD1639013.1 radical SAM protein [Methanomicrobiales archaeon]